MDSAVQSQALLRSSVRLPPMIVLPREWKLDAACHRLDHDRDVVTPIPKESIIIEVGLNLYFASRLVFYIGGGEGEDHKESYQHDYRELQEFKFSIPTWNLLQKGESEGEGEGGLSDSALYDYIHDRIIGAGIGFLLSDDTIRDIITKALIPHVIRGYGLFLNSTTTGHFIKFHVILLDIGEYRLPDYGTLLAGWNDYKLLLPLPPSNNNSSCWRNVDAVSFPAEQSELDAATLARGHEGTCAVCLRDLIPIPIPSPDDAGGIWMRIDRMTWLVRMPSCFHVFHFSCIFQWFDSLTSICPLCNK